MKISQLLLTATLCSTVALSFAAQKQENLVWTAAIMKVNATTPYPAPGTNNNTTISIAYQGVVNPGQYTPIPQNVMNKFTNQIKRFAANFCAENPGSEFWAVSDLNTSSGQNIWDGGVYPHGANYLPNYQVVQGSPNAPYIYKCH